MYLFVILVAYLVIEGSTLAFVAGHTGWLAALGLIFLVSMGGAYLVRHQGAQALVRIQAALARHESPDRALLDGVFIFAAGLLLFLPGFLSDLIGIVLLIPPLRQALGPWLLGYLKSRVDHGRYIKTYTVYDCEWREPGQPESRIKIIDLPARQTPAERPANPAQDHPAEPGGQGERFEHDEQGERFEHDEQGEHYKPDEQGEHYKPDEAPKRKGPGA